MASQPSTVNFLARGERVVLSSENSRDNRASFTQNHPPRKNGDLPPAFISPSRKPMARHNLFSEQVGDLSKTLVFADDAMSSLETSMCSYASARRGTRKLFTHQNMEVFTAAARKRLPVPTGRHNNRGPGGKHLPCHLMQPLPHVRAEKGAGEAVPGDELTERFPPLEEKTTKRGLVEKGWQMQDGADELTPSSPKDYLEQLEAGAKPIYMQDRESTIVLDNNTMFKKVLQVSYPQPPARYVMADHTKEKMADRVSQAQGQKRWLALPQPIEPSADLPWECFSVGSSTHLSDFEEMNQKSSLVSEQPEKHEFFRIMKEWCGQWKLHIRLREVGDDDSLVQQIRSVSDHTRMYAVAAISVLAENQAVMALKTYPQTGLLLETLSPTHLPPAPWAGRKVSALLVQELERLLEDSTVHVRVPSALTLYCMGQHSKKAEDVLHSALTKGVRVSERWAAVQCLVCAGNVSPAIVSELLLHMLDSYSPAEQARATALLAMASYKTDLVHSMVADQLNNSGWQERLAACTVLPLLHKNINRDMYTKLLELAWEDWSPEVQHAAAKALGRASHGKIIHDDIIERLKHESVLVRLDAIRKLHSLQLMTTKLLPSYLACFNDQHLSIRLEAAALAGSLKLKHPLVMKALKLQLRDNCWMLKSSSLRALADIGPSECDTELVELLIWAVRFEKVPAVRAEACRTITHMGLREDRVIQALKDVVTVEDVDMVVSEAKKTLVELGHTEKVRDHMLEGVCDNVKRLGTKQAIASELVSAEASSMTAYGLRRPTFQLTVRDYLDDKQRYLAYGDGSSTRGSVDEGRGRRRSQWTPDRQTIDTQLSKMRRRVHSCI